MRTTVPFCPPGRLSLPLILLAAVVSASIASAQNTYSWQPTANSTWNIATNWLDQNNSSGLPLSANNTTLVFGGTSDYTASNDIGAFTVNALNFGGSGTKTIIASVPANRITFAGSAPSINVASGTGAVTVSNDLVLSAATSVENNGSGLLTLGSSSIANGVNGVTFGGAGNVVVNGAFTGTSGTLTKNGAGTLTLTAPNALGAADTTAANGTQTTGNIVVNGGELVVGNLRLTATAGVNPNRGNTTPRTLTVASGAITTVTGTLSITQAGSSYSANTVATGGGILQLRNATASMSNPSLASDIGPSGGDGGPWGMIIPVRVDFGAGATAQWIVGKTNRNDVGRYAGDLRFDGSLTGSAAVQFRGLNQSSSHNMHFVLNADNSTGFTSEIRLANADLALTNSNALTAANAVTFNTVADSNTLNRSTLFLFGRSVTIGSLNDTSASGTNRFIRNGSLNAANGGTGTLAGGGSTPLGVNADSVLTITQTTNGVFGGQIQDGPNDTAAGAGGTYRTLSLVKAGSATLTLTGANTFTGGVNLSAGTLGVGSNTALGTGTLAVTATGTTINITGTAATLANNITLPNATGRVSFVTPNNSLTTLNGTISGGVASTSTTAVTGTEWFFQGGASGQNTGQLRLNGDNSAMQGTINVQRGPLLLGHANAAGSTLLYLDSNLPPAGVIQLMGNFTVANNVRIQSGAVNALGVDGSLSAGLSGLITSNGALGISKVGTGTLTLSGNNTYTGTTTISAGTLSVASLANGGANSNIGASSNAAANLTLNGGTLRYTGVAGSSDRAFTLGVSGGTIDASGSGALVLTSTTATALSGTDTARTLTLTGTNTGNNTYAGVLGNNGTGATSLAKSGAGTWVLSGANTYTGATTVTGGTLALGETGSINSSTTVTVNTGGTFDVSAITSGYTIGSSSAQSLEGVGTVLGTIVVGSNGTLRGDNGTGTGTLTTRSVTVLADGRLAVQFGSGTSASSLDASAAGSVLRLENGAIIDPNGSLGGDDRVIAKLATGTDKLFVNGTAIDTDAEIGVFEYASGGGVQNFGTSGLKIDLTGLSLTEGDKFTLRRSGDNLVLNFSPVPEPAAMLGVSVAVLAAGGIIRRRLAKK